MKRLCWLVVVACAMVSAAPQVEPALSQAMNAVDQNGLIPVEFFMKAQANALNLDASIANLPKPLRRAKVREVLEQFSATTQADLLSYLSAQGPSRVEDIRSLWLCNLVSCWATKEVIRAVAARPDVDLVLYAKVPVEMGKLDLKVPPAVADGIEPNMVTTNVRGAWAQGYTGQDIVLGVVDTGVRYTHEDLRDHLWTSTEYPNCGFNFASNQFSSGHPGPSTYDTLTPLDFYGHGTHCAGIATADGAYGNGTRDTMGVAPSCKIMSLPVDVYLHSPYPDTSMENNMILGFQFCVSPTRDPTNGADVITTSLGLVSSWLPRRALFRQCEENVMAAGLPHCIAAGNEGPSARTIRCPGDCPPPWPNPANHPSDNATSAVITVGATDNNDNAASFTSIGPTDWGSVAPYNDYAYPPGLMDPDVCAPGVNILSTYNSGDQSYTQMSGTSMATPGVAGCVALMLSKNPVLTPREVDSILEMCAVTDLGPSGKDVTYGAGRINCSLAVACTPFPGPRHDVAVSFARPGPRVDPGVAIAPKVLVANIGTYDETGIQVHLEIDSAGTEIYNQMVPLASLDSAEIDSVIFTDWTPGAGGNSYDLLAWHGHLPDTNHANDSARIAVWTRTHDVAATGTNISSRVRSGNVVNPSLTLTATGDYTEHSFNAYCWIDSAGTRIYDQNVTVDSVAPGAPAMAVFPPWTPGPESTVYDVTMFHTLAGDQVHGNDTLYKSTISLLVTMRVAIEIAAGSSGRTPPNACYRIDSLCDAMGWEDSIVSGEEIDSPDELANFSVVVTGDVGYNDNDFPTYQSALLDWVRAGGGFVSMGWYVFGVANKQAWQMDSAGAVMCSGHYGFLTSGQCQILDTTHYITRDVHNFNIYSHGEFANAGIWPDAVALGDYSSSPGNASIVYRYVGDGRSVYLGPIYFANFGGYNNEPYYDDADAMLLLKQALEWAGMGGPPSAVKEEPKPAPALRFSLTGVRPSPMSRSTVVSYTLGSASRVKLALFNLNGQEVTTLASGVMPAGRHNLTWNRADAAGTSIPAGVYFVRLSADGQTATRKLVIE